MINKNNKFLTTLDYYIIKKIIATFFVAIALIILIVIIFDLGEKIDDFIDHKAPLKAIIFDYYCNFIPSFVNLFGHLFFFIAIVFVTSRLTARSEIISILCSGISFKRLLRPYLISAIFIGLINLYFSNYLIPYVNIGKSKFEQQYYRNPYNNQLYNIHIQSSPNNQLYVQRYDNNTKTGYLFSWEVFKGNNVIKKITAETITYDSLSNQWELVNYSVRTIDKDKESLERGVNTKMDIHAMPNDFNLNVINMDILNFNQLNQAIAREELKGTNMVSTLLVEKYQRLFNPLAYIVLTIIGLSLSCKKTRGGTGFNLAIGIGLAFSLILMMKVSQVFAINSNLAPCLAILIPIMLYALIAIYLLKRAPK
ncbi:MAG: LptF/LptG family permease [Bacteroidales bacterium]|jgi:lipopolysaccharide export system permease protein|nr:LptF/LptG family permease [Bacteroidales bacterium]